MKETVMKYNVVHYSFFIVGNLIDSIYKLILLDIYVIIL